MASKALSNVFKLRHIVDVMDPAYGAKGDGVTDDYAAFEAARAYVTSLALGGVIWVPPGQYVIGTDLTLDADIGLSIWPGAQLQPTVGKTLTINGPIIDPIIGVGSHQIFGGLGSVVISTDTTPAIWADWFVGADIGLKINAALAAITGSDTGPGTIKIGAKSYDFSNAINLTGAEGVRLCTDSGPLQRSLGARLRWTGGVGSGAALKLIAAQNVEVDHIYMQYNNAAYDGNLIDLNSTGAANDGTGIHIHHCGFSGSSAGEDGALRLISLGACYDVTIDHNWFDFATTAIGRADPSALDIEISNNHFGAGLTTAIVGGSGAWDIYSNTHQNDAAAPVKTFFKLAGEQSGLSIRDNVLGVDAGAGVGKIIDLVDAVASGIDISGNLFSAAAGTAIQCHETAGSTSGISITGNKIIATTGVALGKADGISMTGNNFSNTATPWNGTAPTRYNIAGNRGDNMDVAGVVVANDATIDITKPGTPNDGFGTIMVTMSSDAAQAHYLLNGPSGTTTEVYDPSGLFTITQGNAATANIYWDAGSSAYRLENRRGGSRTFVVTYIGR